MPIEVLTPAEIAEVKALCDAATPGPWYEKERRYATAPTILADVPGFALATWTRNIAKVMFDEVHGSADPDVFNNARFIAAARTLLPRALATIEARDAEIERLRAENAQLRELLAGFRGAVSVTSTGDGPPTMHFDLEKIVGLCNKADLALGGGGDA
jgi:hypothetical protein